LSVSNIRGKQRGKGRKWFFSNMPGAVPLFSKFSSATRCGSKRRERKSRAFFSKIESSYQKEKGSNPSSSLGVEHNTCALRVLGVVEGKGEKEEPIALLSFAHDLLEGNEESTENAGAKSYYSNERRFRDGKEKKEKKGGWNSDG